MHGRLGVEFTSLVDVDNGTDRGNSVSYIVSSMREGVEASSEHLDIGEELFGMDVIIFRVVPKLLGSLVLMIGLGPEILSVCCISKSLRQAFSHNGVTINYCLSGFRSVDFTVNINLIDFFALLGGVVDNLGLTILDINCVNIGFFLSHLGIDSSLHTWPDEQ